MYKHIDPDPRSPAKICARYVASIPQSFMQIQAILLELWHFIDLVIFI